MVRRIRFREFIRSEAFRAVTNWGKEQILSVDHSTKFTSTDTVGWTFLSDGSQLAGISVPSDKSRVDTALVGYAVITRALIGPLIWSMLAVLAKTETAVGSLHPKAVTRTHRSQRPRHI